MSSSVFSPSDFPEYTYVPRDELHHERLLREWLRSSTQIASISGPSKSGKTVLVQRVAGKDKLVTVSGASVRSADQLWERVLDWWGEPHAMMTSTVETSTDTDTREHGGTIGLSGTGASHRSAHANAAAAAETLQVTANRRGLPQVVQELAGGPYTLLLDDFHYIPPAVQADVAQQLKDASSRGVRICVANVPYKADNVVRALPELHGRVLAIDLDYWSKRDLLEIPRLGCPLLGLDIDRATLEMFATEAAGSPQLMQAICQWMCNHLGCRETIDPPRTVVLDETARKEILFLTSHLTDFRSLVRALIGGPRVKPGDRRAYAHKDGRSGDVYLTLMRALAMDPPRLMFQRNDVVERLERLCKEAPPDTASVVRACAMFGQIAQNFAPPTGPSLEWDEQAGCLIISDPYLLFYLRWSVILEREADAMM
jgi:hypothetical protein